ncbi:PH domain-containing protein [Amphibacillus indicireducens]|uniref:PH domain-containing protein n=1 Tax=Amphibacillus indicireducens TaxID=1076330 RepID=A0ABP7V2E0_9BACI
MREHPKNRIERSAIRVWRIHGLIWSIIFTLSTASLFASIYQWGWPIWIGLISAALTLIIIVLSVFLFPPLRWRRWRYQLYDQEIYIQHGILIIKRTIVPMVRVQHVDTKQGPILRKFKLASLQVSTAATTHEIPALKLSEAEALRDQISVLARVEQNDI